MLLSFLRLPSNVSLTRNMRLLGGLVASVFAITIPSLYFGLSVYALHESLKIETAGHAKTVEQIIQARPDMWEFEQVRLLEMIAQPSIDGDLDERTIRTAAGTVVAKTDFSAIRPAVTVSATVFDSGNPVGSIEARHSIRKQLFVTALLGMLSSSLGYLLFFVFRTYPIRRLENALAGLKQAEEKERRNRETAERLAQEIAIIAEIGKVVGSTLDTEEIYERFATEVRKLIPFDSLTINKYNFQENTLRVDYVYGLDIDGRRQGDPLVLKGSLSEAVIRDRTSLCIQPASIDEILGQFPKLFPIFQAGLRSIMCVPLLHRDEVIGVLHFRSKTPNAYTEKDLRLAERIEAQIAGAIASTQLFADLKKAENSLKESEGRFRGMVEQAAVGVAEIEKSTGRFITVNNRLCEIVGRTEEELMATTFLAITHPEDLHLHEEKTALLLAGKIRSYTLEKRYLRKDEESVWVNLTTSPLWKLGEKPGRNMIVVEDITDRKRLEAGIREMSLRDLLTDLYNRRGFITLAEQQIRAADRVRRKMLLMFIDCDGLKWINDTLGHEEGDKALIDTANVLRQTFRNSDVIARLGGDEFAVLSIDATDINPEDFPKRLQQNIDAGNAKEARPYKLAMSWGTAIYDPVSPMSLDEMMSSADERMYAQKKAKRNLRN